MISAVSDTSLKRDGATGSDPVDLSVVVVTFNSEPFIAHCLRAVNEAVGHLSHETIVVDNASSDGTPDRVRQAFPEAHVIETGRNAGFAAGCNLGIAASTGTYVVLLNPDTEPRGDALSRLVEVLEHDGSIGATGPRLLNPDLSDQGTARSFPTPAAAILGRRSPLTLCWPGNPWSRRYLTGQYHSDVTPFDIDWVSGACLMVRREVLETVGPLDGAYFMYWEDADWCRRIVGAGYRIVCEPQARVVHDEGAARGRRLRQHVWFHLGAYRYYAKHHMDDAPSALRILVMSALAARATLTIASSSARRRVRAVRVGAGQAKT